MAKKKKQKNNFKLLNEKHEDRMAILRVRAQIKAENTPRSQRVEVVNGVVSIVGRYSRLYEDYDDK